MSTSIYLAQLLGLAFTLTGLGILFNPKHYDEVMHEVRTSAHFLYMGGILAFVGGFAIVKAHDMWASDWTIIITIIGWLVLLKGALLLAMPTAAMKMYRAIIKSTKNIMHIEGIITLILGLILGYMGFFS